MMHVPRETIARPGYCEMVYYILRMKPSGFLWRNGVEEPLNLPEVDGSGALGPPQLVGEDAVLFTDGVRLLRDRSLLRALPRPPGFEHSLPRRVSGSYAVGSARPVGGPPLPIRWTDSRHELLKLLDGLPFAEANDVNACGVAVGSAGTVGDPTAAGRQAVVWGLDGVPMTLTTPADAHSSAATVIGPQGWIGGLYRRQHPGEPRPEVFAQLWIDGVAIDLSSLPGVAAAGFSKLFTPVRINSSGQMAGTGIHRDFSSGLIGYILEPPRRLREAAAKSCSTHSSKSAS